MSRFLNGSTGGGLSFAIKVVRGNSVAYAVENPATFLQV